MREASADTHDDKNDDDAKIKAIAGPALLGTLADAVDLDGPLWLSKDVEHGLKYEGGTVFPPSRDLWG